MARDTSMRLAAEEKRYTTIPKRVSFPDTELETTPKLLSSRLSKSKSLASSQPEISFAKTFKPAFACFRQRFLSCQQPEVKKQFLHHKRSSNFSLISTQPTFQHLHGDTAPDVDDEGMYTENTQNKVEIKANLICRTKLRTLNALASILKNRKAVPTDTLSKMRAKKKLHACEDTPVSQTQVHTDSYDTVVKILKAAQVNNSNSKKRHIKVMIDLPKLPFGKHVTYNSVKNFKGQHVVDFEASAQLMDKVTNEIWVRRLERRRTLDVEPKSGKKAGFVRSFLTEELQLYNSKLKVAEENLYVHYSTGSQFWRKDLKEKQAGWRDLYRLELKHMSDLNASSTF